MGQEGAALTDTPLVAKPALWFVKSNEIEISKNNVSQPAGYRKLTPFPAPCTTLVF
jgi:hypothetical protein